MMSAICAQLRKHCAERHLVALLLFGFLSATNASAQKRVTCDNGEVHVQIDLKQIAIQYQGSSLAGTLSGLSVFASRLAVEPKTLQIAAAATQQWNEFLKGLVTGYNGCAITKSQYNEGLQRIYPRLKEDAADLEQIRKLLLEGQPVNEARLERLLESYLGNLRRFAEVSGQETLLEQISAVVERAVEKGTAKVLSGQEQILNKLESIKRSLARAPLATPAEVKEETSALRASLLAKVDEAEAAYDQGYALLNRYRFPEAIPYFEQALASVKLPDFYLALASAFYQLPDLHRAENILREGLDRLAGGEDLKHEASLANLLGLVLQDKGDLEGALSYTQRALAIDEEVFGPHHPNVAIRASNIGQILQDKGDLEGALSYTQRALAIDEEVFGPHHPNVAIRASNIGQILQDKGDLEGALTYTQRALEINEKVYGPHHPNVAIRASNIGQILQDKGDLEGALTYTQRALEILSSVYGLNNPTTKQVAENLARIKQEMK